MRPRPLDGPDDHHQIGDGTFIDQVIGQYAARVAGLAPVLDLGHVSTTLDTIFRKNFRESLADHLNVMRSFALTDESGVLMCSYPDGARPRRPFPYHSEVMTGFEHALATAHVYDGDRATAVRIVESTRRRYDGRRRNPFDEAEAGHHYARALASWSAFVAWNGFAYRAPTGRFTMDFHDAEGSTFWSTGSAYGTWRQWRVGGRLTAEISVIEGTIRIDEVVSHGIIVQAPRETHGAGARIPVDLGPVG
jgi:non-lysosomal glucosylceramidase